MVRESFPFVAIPLGIFAAAALLFIGNIYAPYRAYKARQWGWFWATLLPK